MRRPKGSSDPTTRDRGHVAPVLLLVTSGHRLPHVRTHPSDLCPTLRAMSHTAPAPLACSVAHAITHYRDLGMLDTEHLAEILAVLGSPLTAADLRDIEDGTRLVALDDLPALARALEVTVPQLLAHVPPDTPLEEPPALGVPDDMSPGEFRAWLEGRTGLTLVSRIAWVEDQIADLQVAATHHADQLDGARAEIAALGELAIQEADTPPVWRLEERLRSATHAVQQVDMALAYAEQHRENLLARTRMER